jgi:carboxylesterase type B
MASGLSAGARVAIRRLAVPAHHGLNPKARANDQRHQDQREKDEHERTSSIRSGRLVDDDVP